MLDESVKAKVPVLFFRSIKSQETKVDGRNRQIVKSDRRMNLSRGERCFI